MTCHADTITRTLSGRLAATALILAGCAHIPEPPAPRPAALPASLEIPTTDTGELHRQPDTVYADLDASETVALDKLVEATLRANPELQADLAHYEGRLQRIPQQTALPDPSVQMKVARSRGGSMPGERLFPPPAVQFPERQSMPSTTAYTLQVMQPVPWPERLRLKGRIAEEEAAAAFEIHNIRLLDIIHEISRNYYTLAFEHAALALTHEEKMYVEQFLETTLVGYSVGRHGRQPLLKAQTELARLDNDLLSFPGRMAPLYAALRARVGDPETANALLAQRRVAPIESIALMLPETTPDVLAEQAMRLLPEAVRLEREIEIGRLAQAVAREDYRPDFVVGLEYMNSAAASMGMGASGRRDTLGVMAGITIPVPNARRRAQLAEARLVEAEAKHRKRALAINTAETLEAAFEQLYSLSDRVSVYEESLIPLAEETYETSRAEYETGIGDYLNLLDALRTVVLLRREQLELKRDTLLLLADIQRITGARFVFRPAAPIMETYMEEFSND